MLSSSAFSIPSSLGCPIRTRHTVNSISPFHCHHAPCNSLEQDYSGAAGPGSPIFPGFPHNHSTCMSPNLHVWAQSRLTGWSNQHFIQVDAFFKHFLHFGSSAPLSSSLATPSPSFSTFLRLEALRAQSLGLFSPLHSCDRRHHLALGFAHHP